jgi:uncharacterized protein (AIM24 family)
LNFDVLDRKSIGGATVEVVSYGTLAGSADARTAEQLFFLREAGMKLKAVRLTLDGGKARVEPGALYWMKGALEMRASTGGGILRAAARRLTSGESFFVNELHGRGQAMLEPTYGHFILVELDDDALIVDKGMFYAGIGNLDIGASMQSNIGAGVFGGEGWFQTKISGKGVVALFSPVPMDELVEVDLAGDKLSVDGNFALMRTGDIKFSVEKSSKSWMATSVSGEGLLQVFEGTGKVWLAPTQEVYEKLATPKGLEILSRATGARTNNVGS